MVMKGMEQQVIKVTLLYSSIMTPSCSLFTLPESAPATSLKSQGITTSTTEGGPIMTFNISVIAGAVVGGIVGCLLVLVLIILLLMLASLWLTKKYKRATDRETYKLQQLREEGGVTETEQQLQDNQTLEMKNNEAYATALQISTENNIAYVKMENDYINDQGEYDYV